MSSELQTIEFIAEQMEGAGEITYRAMFGEYALYCDGKIMALVCDDQLFVKPTEAGRSFIEDVVEVPPYPGAKPYFLIEDQIEDREWIATLVRLSVKELPEPKPKSKPKQKK
jgi:TfoX/Sxy family transcriptional regulator of competence genes